MKDPTDGPVFPICMLAHECMNKLSVIIGHCDLAGETTPGESDYLERIATIRDTANAMADAMSGHQCELSELLQFVPVEEWPSSIGGHVRTRMRHGRRPE